MIFPFVSYPFFIRVKKDHLQINLSPLPLLLLLSVSPWLQRFITKLAPTVTMRLN